MKFTVSADLHITNKSPANRKDDYFQSCLNKFKYLLDATEKYTDNGILVVAGDFFDNYGKDEYQVTNSIIEILWNRNIEILVVPGQHDERYHRKGLHNTPLGSLEAAGFVHILKNDKKLILDGVSFIGSGWNEEPEEEADVMVTHRMVTKNKELFVGQEETEFITSNQILHKYKWAKLIISGDNHKPHISKRKGRTNLNCGSMMRKSKDQIKYKPAFYIVDSDDWSIETKYFNIEKPENVFDFNKLEKETEKDKAKKKAEEDIDKFISALPKEEKEKPNFRNVLNSVIKQIKPNKSVVNIINEVMETVS